MPCLTAWAESLGGITYPLLSDFYPHGHVAQCFSVLRSDGRSERAIFVVDKRGIIRYVDVHDIDDQPDNEELFRVLGEIEPFASVKAPAPTPVIQAEPTAEVVLYCTPWCPGCRHVRDYLKSKKISYVEIDITRDRAAALRVRGWANGYETTPTLNVRGQVVVGFDRLKLDKLF